MSRLPSRGERALNLLCALSVWSWAPLGVMSDGTLGPVRLTIVALHLTVGWCFLTRGPLRRNAPWAFVVGALPALLVGGLAFRLAQPTDWPLALTVVFVIGGAIACAALLNLGPAFAVLPAARGVVTGGLYRLVRHPAYLGEGLMVIACAIAAGLHHALWLSPALLAVFLPALMLRIMGEERVLSGDAAYGAYRSRVRWRLVPGIW